MRSKRQPKIDIFIAGVGGQGIGLLSEALLRAVDSSGQTVKGVDTHGLAQRGGTVTSHLRIGPGAHSPLVSAGCADLVVALERNEALRALDEQGKSGSTLVYYDAELQPLPVRLGRAPRCLASHVEEGCARRGVSLHRVFLPDLSDPRMQNTAVLGVIARESLLPGVNPNDYEQALQMLLKGDTLQRNLTLFRNLCSGVQ